MGNPLTIRIFTFLFKKMEEMEENSIEHILSLGNSIEHEPRYSNPKQIGDTFTIPSGND